MAIIEFSANPSCPPKRPRSPPPLGRDEFRNSVDHISQLPDAIILHIFSFLTSEDAVRTSVLSKRWRSTWTANPHLSFPLPYGSFGTEAALLERCIAFMEAVLLRCTAIKVKSFLFEVPRVSGWRESRIDRGIDSGVGPTIDRWLHFAVGHGLEELTLRKDNIYALPQFFFRCTTLVSSHLSGCCFSKIATVNWSSLKRLHIEDAELEDDTMMRVLRGSPVLEFLQFTCCAGLKRIIVESRCLRELVIDDHRFHHAQVPILRISAPHLLKLRLLGIYPEADFETDSEGELDSYPETDFNRELVEFKLGEVSSLVEAELNFEIELFEDDKVKIKVCVDIVKRLLERLQHVTTLVIGSWFLQVLSITEAREVFLPSLECQHLMFHVATDHEGVHSIVKILKSSPRLEKLFLQMTCISSAEYPFAAENVGHRNFDAKELRNSAKRRRIHRCLKHLKDVEIVDPGANWLAWEPVLSLLKFLLQNARGLDKIKINGNNSNLTKRLEPWGLLEVARIILSDPNRSPNLKVILSYPSRGCPSESLHLQAF